MLWPLQAQQDSSRQAAPLLLEVGLSANAYRGDLATYEFWAPAFQLGLKFNKHHRWNSHFNLGIGRVQGQNFAYNFDEAARPNLYFRTSFFSFQYDLQYHFIKNQHWHLYLSQGVGFLSFTPRNEEGLNLQDLLNTRAPFEEYANIALMFPTSLGIGYFLNNGYGLTWQMSFWNTATDYLDNISAWGLRSGNDNVLSFKFSVSVPLLRKNKKSPNNTEEPPLEQEYTR